MQNVDTAYVFTMVLPYIKIGDVGSKTLKAGSEVLCENPINTKTRPSKS